MFGSLAGLDDETTVLILTEKQVIAAGSPLQRSPAGCQGQEGRWGDDEVDDDDDDDVAMKEEVDPSVDADLELLRLAEREKLLTANKALLHQIFLARD